jgi:hypothetical protein
MKRRVKPPQGESEFEGGSNQRITELSQNQIKIKNNPKIEHPKNVIEVHI